MEHKKKQIKEPGFIELMTFRYLPYWPLFVIVLVLCIAAAWGYLNIATPLYQANATIMVKDEKKGVDDSKLMDALNIYNSSNIAENEIEVLRSNAVLNEVVKELHLYAPVSEIGLITNQSAYLSSPIVIEAKDLNHIKDTLDIPFKINAKKEVVIGNHVYPMNTWVKTPFGILQFEPNDKKIKEPLRPLSFSLFQVKEITAATLLILQVNAASKLSTVINLSIKNEVPQKAEDILNKILEVYNISSVREKNKLAANTLNFVTDRLRFVERDLDSTELAIQQFKSKKNITNLSDQGRLYLQNVGDYDRRSADVSLQMAVLDQVEQYVISNDSKASIMPSTLGLSDLVLTGMLQKLSDDESKYEVLKKTAGENNPAAISVAREIENIRPELLQLIRNQKNALITSKRELSNTTNSYNSQLQTIPKKERELLDINRQQNIKNDIYTFLLHKREETALSYASTVADSWIISPAQSTALPVSPIKIIVLLIALIMGVLIAAGIVNLKEVATKKVMFRADIGENTKVPVSAELLHVKGKKELVITDEKGSMIGEQFRQLRATIGMYGKNTAIKKLLVTSSITGEGKTFVSTNLALSLAYSGKKVLLLDLDLRNPKISSIVGIVDRPGIAEYLSGNIKVHDLIHNIVHRNLFVISAGGETVNPTELLLNGKIGDLFEAVENKFDYIVIDSPPIAPMTDAYVLSEYSDTTLFVIKHRFTPKKMIQTLDDSSKIKALKNVSIVFNGIRSRGMLFKKFGYGYGFGYEYVYKEKIKKGQRHSVMV